MALPPILRGRAGPHLCCRRRTPGARGGRLGLALLTLVLTAAAPAWAAAAVQGDRIVNVAQVSAGGGTPVLSNAATITLRVPTPSAIEILQYAPSAAGARAEAMVPGAYRAGEAQGGWAALPLPRPAGADQALALPASLGLLPTRILHQGDPIFLRVTDQDQNLDRGARDRLEVTLTDALTGDTEQVQLTEDGNDRGVFVGYLPSVRSRPGAASPFDGALQVVEQSTATARYVDPVDADDVSIATALFDPTSRVFDSRTGQPVSGVEITVIDEGTGQPAQVRSDDGTTSFPATIVSGQAVTDGAGRRIDFGPGEFRFPFLAPGTYRFRLSPPDGYAAPSRVDDATFQALPGGPFSLDAKASRGEAFVVDPGPTTHVDLPVDPGGVSLWVQKTAGLERASLGDFVPYTIAVTNTDATRVARGLEAIDTLPPGFRYRPGTTRIAGAPAPDPEVSPDGRTLTFSLGTLQPAATVSVRFAVQVGAGAQVGKDAVNLATARAGAASASNLAQARIRVEDTFLSRRTFLMGRVTEGPCDEALGEGDRGVEGIRVFLEDGTFALSDSRGLFHFEGVREGSHVVQLDLDSVPEGYEVFSCDRNTREAGRAFSRFVDVQGDTLWRVDFHLRSTQPPAPPPPPPAKPAPPQPPGSAGLSLRHTLPAPDEVAFQATLRGARAPLTRAEVRVTLPEGLAYVSGSSQLDGAPLADPRLDGAALIYPLDTLPADFRRSLTFHARLPRPGQLQEVKASAVLSGMGVTGAKLVTAPAENVVRLAGAAPVPSLQLTFRPHFAPLGVELSEADREALRAMAGKLKRSHAAKIVLTGYTDSQPIRAGARKRFADNVALSLARAQSVRTFLLGVLPLDEAQVVAEGKGEADPIADNRTAEGRALNRRVRVEAFEPGQEGRAEVISVQAESGEQTVAAPVPQPAPPPAAAPPSPVPAPAGATPASPSPASSKPEDGVVSPADGEMLAERINAVQVRIPAELTPGLEVDGQAVPAARIGYRKKDEETGKLTVTYVGIDLGAKGSHTLTATGTDPFGNVRFTRTARVLRTGEIASLRLVDAGQNVADGRTPVKVRVELRDASGDVIRGATRLTIVDGNLRPYHKEGEFLTVEQLAADRTVPMDKDGTVLFAPVATSGSYHAVLQAGAARLDVETWAKAKLRDWILVGLAEGTVGYNVLKGNMETLRDAGGDDALYDQGRVALYAKGKVLGKWLLTLAYDSARSPNDPEKRLFQQIDPSTYFTLYGDASQQQYDASSVRKIYVKIEREQFYALFGDLDTGLTVTELSRYSRRMNGAKTELQTEHVEVNAFAAKTDQVYVRDEIPGDGTSGLYRLSRAPLLPNSETVTLITRDRFRSEVVLESRTLTRYLDYSIDPDQGLLFFREPIPSRDPSFNPITIVVEYETQLLAGGDYTLGGRAGVKFLGGDLRAGVTAVHEGQGARKNDLLGADVKLELGASTRLRGELAGTDSRQGAADTRGMAWLAEVTHSTRRFDATAYFRGQQGTFGLGQQPFSEAGTRKLGLEGAYHFSDPLSLSAQAYRQDTYATGVRRLFGTARLNYVKDDYSGYAGVLEAQDRLADGSDHDSGQLLLGGRWRGSEKLTLGLDYAQSVWGNGSVDYPTRVGLTAEYKLTAALAAFATQELSWGDAAVTRNTRLGLRSTPWKGGTLITSAQRDFKDDASRIFGNIGLRQTWQLSEQWKVDLSAERSQTLDRRGNYMVNPAYPPASGNVTGGVASATGEDFTAVSGGATYQYKRVVWDSRAELRVASADTKWTLLSGAVYDLNEAWAFSGKWTLLGQALEDGKDLLHSDLRFGAVYRPPRTRWILLDRLDWIVDRGQSGLLPALDAEVAGDGSWRVVNLALANYRPRKDWQLSLGYGGKLALQRVGGEALRGYTDQLSVELRHDLTERFDVGARASVRHVWTGHELAYSAGPSVGYSPAKNLWLGVGFNFTGYEDRDFSAAEYTALGPWLRVRFKFDQESVREAASWLTRQ